MATSMETVSSFPSKWAWIFGGAAVALAAGGIAFLLSRQRPNKHIQTLVTPDRRLTDNFKAKLAEIFAAQLDLDGDGALNDAELDRLVFLTEGQRITPEMAEFIRSHFETNDEGWLTLSGFVASYEWILQHLTDDSAAEQAFAKDLQAYGYTYARFKQN
ncbi:uncharacterized protein ACA1_288570 [Acanthamoeba castellanii str. Neff]|uniref:EF hand domain containing protein n=1 Tax=Acanthamoeba castellanii (strain ATCC 30010 / Neff) TaxID=1257118 RepID=L8HL95_ACACF|nr:uncharacterized protein ACA1_288570 [Acanthamoeba castellanii str. Neff]ELR25136.1 hypothetical protein ACA1_288570 [Acanthamoeba castellanii str. Neff]